MTLFYNSKTKKPQPWVYIVFVVLPVVMAILVVILGGKRVQQKMEEERRESQTDVFEKF